MAASPATLIQEGALTDPKVLIAAGAFVLIFALRGARGDRRGADRHCAGNAGRRGAGLSAPARHGRPAALHCCRPSCSSISRRRRWRHIVTIVFVFLLIDMLDTSGTLTAVGPSGQAAGRDGHLPNARRALAADAAGTMIGAAARHLAGHGLYRKRRGHRCRRAHRPDGRGGGRAVPGQPVPEPAGRRRAAPMPPRPRWFLSR